MSQPEKPRSPIDPARNVLEVVTNLKAGLRNSDRKVAELVLENPGVVLGATLAKTARRARVSEPTVIRFCEAIGCSGFRDFKLRLAQSLALATAVALRRNAPHDARLFQMKKDLAAMRSGHFWQVMEDSGS